MQVFGSSGQDSHLHDLLALSVHLCRYTACWFVVASTPTLDYAVDEVSKGTRVQVLVSSDRSRIEVVSPHSLDLDSCGIPFVFNCHL